MDKEEKELIDKLSLAVATFNITAIDNPNMIILRKDLKKVLDLCLKQKEVIDKIKKELIENEVLDELAFDVSEKICDLFEEVSE